MLYCGSPGHVEVFLENGIVNEMYVEFSLRCKVFVLDLAGLHLKVRSFKQ